MAKKPTYEELEKRVKELEKETCKHKQAEEALRDSKERFKEMMADLLPTITSELDKNSYLTYTNQAASETLDYSKADLEDGLNVIDKAHPDDRERAIKNTKKIVKRKELDANEYRLFKEDGSELTMLVLSRPLYKNGKVVGIRSTLTDITKRRIAEQALKEKETELEIKTKSLEEINTSLRVLLKRRDEDKRELEEKLSVNVRELVFPFLEKVKKGRLDPEQIAYMRVVESNLNDIVSPFLRTLPSKYSNLTPKEIHVANLIREGTTSKGMAKLMNLSPRTIETHRQNIRKKLGIEKNKRNLRTHLLSS